MRSLADEGPRDFRGCVDAIAGIPQYEPLRDKVYLGAGGEYRSSYLRNRAKPDDSDIDLLKAVHGDIQNCRKIALSETKQPNERQALAESHAADDKVWADVLAGRLTWGRFNEGRRVVAMRQLARLNVAREPEVRDTAPQSKRATKIDIGYEPEPNMLLPEWANRQRERTPSGLSITTGERSVYCDHFRYTKYCNR